MLRWLRFIPLTQNGRWSVGWVRVGDSLHRQIHTLSLSSSLSLSLSHTHTHNTIPLYTERQIDKQIRQWHIYHDVQEGSVVQYNSSKSQNYGNNRPLFSHTHTHSLYTHTYTTTQTSTLTQIHIYRHTHTLFLSLSFTDTHFLPDSLTQQSLMGKQREITIRVESMVGPQKKA